MLFMNERFKPSMAVPIKVTVRMPMTMPSVVKHRTQLVRADGAPRDDWAFAQFGEEIHAPRIILNRLIAGDEAVADADNTSGVAGDFLLVRDNDDGVAFVAPGAGTTP